MKTYEQRTQDILQKAKEQKGRRATKRIISWCSVAACILVFNLIMFVPYTTGGFDVTAYADSEYYPVIQQLSPLTYGKPYKTNLFTQAFNGLSGCGAPKGDMAPSGPGRPAEGDSSNAPDSSGNGNYEEVTNNQTKGVTEGDLFKRSDKYIYYLSYKDEYYTDSAENKSAGYILKVYSIAGTQSELITEYPILLEDKMFIGFFSGREMFLSKDCKTVTVIMTCCLPNDFYYGYKYYQYTQIISIDVSDVNDIKETNRVRISGDYISSRAVDGNLLFVCNYAVESRPDFDDEKTFLPQIGSADSMSIFAPQEIVCPENATSSAYTVICSLNEKTLEIKDKIALLSFSRDLYVSENNLFITREYITTTETNNEYKLTYTNRVTDIYTVEYSDGTLTEKGSVTIDGVIPDRYCMDEYKGVLRVFTNVSYSGSYTYKGENPYDFMDGSNLCNLYCIDLNDFEFIAKETAFAPLGESVRSARFYGDTAYVCTAIEIKVTITDPVFAFDLSDYNNITYKDTGTIPGYSLSLISFTNDTLLGIGYGDSRSDLKVEIYRQTETAVDCVTQFISENTSFSSKFKAYFIDAENGFIGLGTRKDGITLTFTLLHFDGYRLNKIANVLMEGYICDDVRATYIDGYMYLLSTNTFKVFKV